MNTERPTMALRYRKHTRLPDHDYLHGADFVTLCTLHRQQVFGQVMGKGSEAAVTLTKTGRIVDECWCAIADHFLHVRLGEMQIMPDHLHAILILDHALGAQCVPATHWVAPTDATDGTHRRPRGPQRGSLGAIIGAFKSETTKRVNRMNGTTGKRLWQPNFHDRVTRENGGEHERIARYIAENPANWR